MNQGVRIDALSYELGVLMAMGYHREDQAIKDSLETIFMAIGQDQLDGKHFLDGLKTELTSEEGYPPAEEVVIEILLEYLDERPDLVVEEIMELIQEGAPTDCLSEEAIAAWASDIFSQVTDYAEIEESELSFKQIGEELQGYRDLNQSNLEGAINCQLQAAGYRYSTKSYQWEKSC